MGFRKAPRALAFTVGLLFAATSAFCQNTNLASFVDLNGGQHIFFQETNFDVNQMFYLPGGTAWMDQDLLQIYGGNPAEADSPLTAFVDASGAEHVFYLDTNSNLNQTFYPGGASWIPQNVTALAGGGNLPAASLTGYVDGTGDQHVAYMDANAHLNQLFYSVALNTWYPQDLTAAYGAVPAAGSALTEWNDQTVLVGQHIGYIDANGDVHQLVYFGGSTWADQDMTAVYGGNPAAAGSAIASFIDSSFVAHVVYEDNNQHLNQLVNSSPTTWVPQDLTASYGGNLAQPAAIPCVTPPIAPATTPACPSSHIAAYNDSFGIQRIAYLDANQNLNGLSYYGGFLWATANLTQIYGGTKPAAGSTLAAFIDDAGGQHIAYVDANEHISQIFNVAGPGQPWYPQDLTAIYSGNTPELVPGTGVSISLDLSSDSSIDQ